MTFNIGNMMLTIDVIDIVVVILVILAVLLLSAVVIALLTFAKKPKNVQKTQPPTEFEKYKYAELLSEMVKCDTVSHRDRPQTKKFEAFQMRLQELFPLLFEKCEAYDFDKAMLIYWRGKDPSLKPLVLMSHMDVVEATGDWTYGPFSGEIMDGVIWGRGTVDTKSSLCAFLQAATELLEAGFVPQRDIYFVSSDNEETMGDGAPKIVEYFKQEGIYPELVLDEGGAIVEKPMPGVKGACAMVGIMEKGYADVRFTARSNGGHASTPGKNTPIARLAKLINHMEKKKMFKRKISKEMVQMFKSLRVHMSFGYRLIFANLWLFKRLLKGLLPKLSNQAAAMMATTCAFTMARGSGAPNVLPEEASVVANLRFIRHQNREKSLAKIKKVAEKYDVEMEVLYSQDCSPVADTKTRGFQYIQQCIERNFEGVHVAKYIMTGCTDSRHFKDITDCTIRFSPIRLNAQQLASVHGIDENVSMDALAYGVKFYKDFMAHYDGEEIEKDRKTAQPEQ